LIIDYDYHEGRPCKLFKERIKEIFGDDVDFEY